MVILWYTLKHKERDLTGLTLRTAPWVWKDRSELDAEELAEIEAARLRALGEAERDAEERKLGE